MGTKNAIITGSNQGIGKATLEILTQNGFNVWACSMNFDSEFEKYCAALSYDHNVWVKPIYFDLCDYSQIKDGVKKILSDKLPINALVNVAGMTKDSLFNMIPIDQMKQIFEVNFFSHMYLTQFVTKIMLKQQIGSIVFVSSIAGIDGSYGQLSYSASKAAIIGATKTLSKELGEKGIRVNAVAPGVINTSMNNIVPEEFIIKRIEKMSIKRMGEPDEIAKAILFLCSDLSTHITGQVIRIDGGMK